MLPRPPRKTVWQFHPAFLGDALFPLLTPHDQGAMGKRHPNAGRMISVSGPGWWSLSWAWDACQLLSGD